MFLIGAAGAADATAGATEASSEASRRMRLLLNGDMRPPRLLSIVRGLRATRKHCRRDHEMEGTADPAQPPFYRRAVGTVRSGRRTETLVWGGTRLRLRKRQSRGAIPRSAARCLALR